jgi:PleD family two-component response regulator
MRWAVQFELVFLAMGLGCLPAGAAVGSSASDIEKFPPARTSYERETFQRIAREEQEQFRKRVSVPSEALEDKVDLSASMGPNGVYGNRSAGLYPGAESAEKVRQVVCVAAVGILAGLLAFRRLAPRLAAVVNTKFDPWALSPSTARRFASQVRAEEASFAEFLSAFRAGQTVASRPATAVVFDQAREVPSEAAESASRKEGHWVEDFFARAPERLAALQKLLEEIRWSDKAVAARRKLLDEFLCQVGALKGPAHVSESLPAWQMASALEGLIKQLTSKSSYITASTLRTIGISLDLLEELCVKGLPSDLVTNPPIRLLAVDDDRITRHALSWALSKALSEPDLAENGEAALARVNRQSYDVILLDVQMPGMDGFELCSKIHETGPNRFTPVVFVTCQSDFNARAEATLCGGIDLIAKPFLTFEITVMALTLALRRRLQARDRITAGTDEPVEAKRLSPSVEHSARAESSFQTQPRREPEAALPKRPRHLPPATRADALPLPGATAWAPMAARPCPELAATMAAGDDSSMPPEGPTTNELARAFFAQAPAHVRGFRNVAQLICHTEDADARQEMLGDLYLFIHSLTINAGLAELRPAFQTSAALEGLLKKLLEKPVNATASALQIVATAVDLLGDLCVEGMKADVSTQPPIRILVVDDDPIARRALGGALQTTFGKPDLAENGASALSLVTHQGYDVIFLDVLMPDMDGFTLCPRIHETSVNRQTPVVFVTSHDDPKLAGRSTHCGGTDFVTKPFLTAEITLKALVYTLRQRLQSPPAAQPRPETAAPEFAPANEGGPK